jgi:hypothetical protein
MCGLGLSAPAARTAITSSVACHGCPSGSLGFRDVMEYGNNIWSGRDEV